MNIDERALAEFCDQVVPLLDERQTRLVLGALADALGRGGNSAVSRASGLSRNTLASGTREVRSEAAPSLRVRRPGGGRRRAEVRDTELIADLVAVLDELDPPPVPAPPIRWTTRSTRELIAALPGGPRRVAPTTLVRLLRFLGFWVVTSPGSAGPARRSAVTGRMTDLVRTLESLDPETTAISVRVERQQWLDDDERLLEVPDEPPYGRIRLRDFAVLDTAVPLPYGVFDIGVNDQWRPQPDPDLSVTAAAVRAFWSSPDLDRSGSPRRLLVIVPEIRQRGRRPEAGPSLAAALSAEFAVEVEVTEIPVCTWRWSHVGQRLFWLVTANDRGRPLATTRATVEVPALRP
ncbi:ISAzo13-like element transposase-related protein [Phytohabitans kaempferiae]|uniref:Transposase n=1 Tax=Phytohabitans kaempferiae TaxID=1620943 RepID=A0ABV6M7D5_9ACTN